MQKRKLVRRPNLACVVPCPTFMPFPPPPPPPRLRAVPSFRGLVYDTGSSVSLIVQYLAGICIGAVLVRQEPRGQPAAWIVPSLLTRHAAPALALFASPRGSPLGPGSCVAPHLTSLPRFIPAACARCSIAQPTKPPCPPAHLTCCSVLFIILMAFPVLISKSLDAPAVLVSKGRSYMAKGGRMAMAKGRQAYVEGKEAMVEAAAKGRQAYEEGKEAVAGAAAALGGTSQTARAEGSSIGAVRPHVEVAAAPAEPSKSAAQAAEPTETAAELAAAKTAALQPATSMAKTDADVEAGESAPLPARHRSLLVTSTDGVLRTACGGRGSGCFCLRCA